VWIEFLCRSCICPSFKELFLWYWGKFPLVMNCSLIALRNWSSINNTITVSFIHAWRDWFSYAYSRDNWIGQRTFVLKVVSYDRTVLEGVVERNAGNICCAPFHCTNPFVDRANNYFEFSQASFVSLCLTCFDAVSFLNSNYDVILNFRFTMQFILRC
jgi:hypothetical protein